ncbi:MAG: hydroxyisourate hydrolase [Pseudolabrys sp.]|nr:hydroxyisourate hydrolase [Pseudolabrys sp.]MBV9260796.1 hydroxyisourate hydrolase [Pseudolabrys sp.]
MGRLSTHVLDTAIGRPAASVKIELFGLKGDAWSPIKSNATNADGRTDKPLLEGADLKAGRYRIEFHIGDYFRKSGAALSDPPFLDVVPIQIGIADPTLHYHVPLLCTPWGYTTYRGS